MGGVGVGMILGRLTGKTGGVERGEGYQQVVPDGLRLLEGVREGFLHFPHAYDLPLLLKLIFDCFVINRWGVEKRSGHDVHIFVVFHGLPESRGIVIRVR